MRICIFDAGAIGDYLSVGLVQANYAVSLVAQGDHLNAIQRNRLTLFSGDRETHATVIASDDPTDLAEQDFFICSLRAH